MIKNVTKLLTGIGIAVFAAVGLVSPAYAVPTLQLDGCVFTAGVCDVDSSFYETDPPGTETIITEQSEFSILAIGTPTGTKGTGDTSTQFTSKQDFIDADLFYLSIALIPKQPEDSGRSLGSFTIDNGPIVPGFDYEMLIDKDGDGAFDTVTTDPITIVVTDDMQWGIPPAALADPASLGPHGIFETFYIEVGFRFNYDDMIETYNTQCRFFDTSIDPDCEALAALISPPASIPDFPDPEGESLFHKFDINVTNLDSEVGLHFDLYYDISALEEFAPYSHDVEYRPPCGDAPPGAACAPPPCIDCRIPEPGTMLMFAFGLLSMAFIRRRVACRA